MFIFNTKDTLLLACFCLLSFGFFAQTQTVRGTVADKVAQSPVPGAMIIVAGTNPVLNAQSDPDGNFTLLNVPVGNQTFVITYPGYEDVVLQQIPVNAGKELVLTINMEESVEKLDEVEVSAASEKNKPLNEMSTVSTRTFSVEETRRFAAAVNDPSRMASSFAGVVTAGDGNNNISIRGNSPNGLLWRMEGVEIPNPNHFSNVGTAGGGISILSSQLLSNSDFSTGAFAAEYGNALSGVFDLRLRKGNNEKREYTVQLGFLGMDVAAEGPFKKGYDGSYLVNYRYSTLNLLGRMGVPIGDASTNFQDLSFNIHLPAKKWGRFTVFGFGGLSYQETKAEKDSLEWKENGFSRYDSHFFSNTGAVGATHVKLFANQSYLKTVLLFSGTQNGYHQEKLSDDYSYFTRDYEERFDQNKVTLSSVYTRKINARHNLRTGIILNRLGYGLRQFDTGDSTTLQERLKENGATETVQGFFQWNSRLSTRWTINMGIHYYQLLLNNANSIEPRAAVKYDAGARHHFTLGYGLHSQLQPIAVYFTEQQINGQMVRSNEGLGFSKAHHVVAGYDWIVNDRMHIKTEIYYQHLFNIPVSTDPASTFSMLNSFDGIPEGALQNTGLGRNYGLELTVERFLFKGLYYLVSASVYESEFRTPGGQWFDTRFNTNYSSTVTVGKEWEFTGKGKNRVLGVNLKSVSVGGFRYTPIDLEASVAAGKTVWRTAETYALRMPDYYRLDVRISLKRNYKNLTGTVALDIQNTTNRQNAGGQYFDADSGEVKYWYQTPLIPILSYRLEF